MGRAGRFGTKGLAITFVSSAGDSEVLNQVSEVHFHGNLRFNVHFNWENGKGPFDQQCFD